MASLSTIRAQLSSGSKSTLKRALCNTVSSQTNTECDVTVMDVSVMAGPLGNDEEALATDGTAFSTAWWLQFGTMFCSAAAFLTFVFFILARRHFKNKKVMDGQVSDVSTVHVLPKDPKEATSPKVPEEGDAKNSAREVYPDAEKGKIAWDEVSLSGSTATPTSDHDGLQDVELYSLS